MQLRVTRWNGADEALEATLRQGLRDESLDADTWSNGALDRYAPHSHEYDKVIYVVSGSITFGLPETGDKIELEPGDRLDLPRGTVHDAVVGSQGVTCLEAHKR